MTGFDDAALRELVRANPGQATFEEYALARDTICALAPCAILIFGVGRDTAMWLAANSGGETRFLEDDERWIAEARRHHPEATIERVRYPTVRALAALSMRFPSLRRITGLPPDVHEGAWDVVLVDGPRGTRWHTPGRVASIAAAARFVRPGGFVLVHDCHRLVEGRAADHFLGREHRVTQVGSMRKYAAPAHAAPLTGGSDP